MQRTKQVPKLDWNGRMSRFKLEAARENRFCAASHLA
jgi:hypothetical protein